LSPDLESEKESARPERSSFLPIAADQALVCWGSVDWKNVDDWHAQFDLDAFLTALFGEKTSLIQSVSR